MYFFPYGVRKKRVSQLALVIKNLPANAGDVGSFPGLGRFPGKGNATHSSVLAWRIPWAGEPGRLQSTGSQDSDMTEHMWVLCAKSLQSCLTLCDPMDCSLPGSSVHGILQARILEWIAVPCCRRSSDSGIKLESLCLLHQQVGSLILAPPGNSLAPDRVNVRD